MTTRIEHETGGRDSGIELLRILAMLAIVAGHFVAQGGISVVGQGLLPVWVSSAGRIAVNVFLLIGCWFMVDAKFRPERMLKLYAEVCFYSIPLTLIMWGMGEAGGFRNVVQGGVPFFGRSVWFASAYISLMALTPFLNRVFELPRTALTRLVILLFILFCIVSTVPQFTPFEYLADFAWFVVVYLTVGWAKRGAVLDRLKSPLSGLLLALGVYTGLCALRATAAAPLADYWLSNIRSLPSLVCSVLVFNAFRRAGLGSIRPINLLARSTFAVYIVHQTPAFEHFEWSLFRPDVVSSLSPPLRAACVVMVALTVFAVVTPVDALRKIFLEPRYLALKPVRFLIEKIAAWYSAI